MQNFSLPCQMCYVCVCKYSLLYFSVRNVPTWALGGAVDLMPLLLFQVLSDWPAPLFKGENPALHYF